MRAWLLFVMVIGLSVLGRAQERTAHVQLENGSEITGRVVLMDLKQLQLVVGEKIVTIDAADIKSCRFEAAPLPGAAPAGETAAVVKPEEGESQTEPAPTENPVPDDAGDHPDEEAAPAAAKPAPARPPLQLVDVPRSPAAAPKSRLGARIEAIDARYPWLGPADPIQWCSLGLLLFSGLSLIIHLSVVIAGADRPLFGRSIALTAIYLVVATAQAALVPTNDFGVFSMLIGNTALVLFALRACYRLHRVNAFVAFAVQVGLVAVAFGVLELVDSLLGSVAA